MPPSRFRINWVLVDELAIGPAPRAERHLDRLEEQGLRAVLSLCSEEEASSLHTSHHTIEMLHEIKVNVVFQEILQHLCAPAVNQLFFFSALWKRVYKRASSYFWLQPPRATYDSKPLSSQPNASCLFRRIQTSWRYPSAKEETIDQ